MKQRNTNVEVLRCILMLLIVIHHSFLHGVFGNMPQNSAPFAKIQFLFSTLIYWHVDGFVAISGWYGIKFTWRKFANLYGVILFYSIAWGIFHVLFAHRFSLSYFNVTGGWFSSGYLMLMLIASLVNAGLELLAAQKKLLHAWLPMAIGVTLSLSPLLKVSAINETPYAGHGFLALLFVYVTARTFRMLCPEKLKLKYLLLLAAVFPIGICGCAMFSIVARLIKGAALDWGVFHCFISYAAPHIWIFAIALVALFVWYVKLPHWIGRICQFLAPSMFCVYLIHDGSPFRNIIIEYPQRWMMAHGMSSPVFCILISGVAVFIVCISIDLVRRLGVHLVRRAFAHVAK